MVNNLEVYGADSLAQVADFLSGKIAIEPTVVDTRAEFAKAHASYDCDFSDVRGQENVKRAFEGGLCGGHNILLIGPPRFRQVDDGQAPAVHNAASHAWRGTRDHQDTLGGRQAAARLAPDDGAPLPQPHHTVSPVAMVGGGSNPMPGEISLAHNGILFLDRVSRSFRALCSRC